MCSRTENHGKKKMLLIRKTRMVEKVNGGDNSTNSENIDLDRRAIHIHGGMEHNLVRYATPMEIQKSR
jgi:hypothetical protein